MAYQKRDPSDDLTERQRALSRWDDEGGAGPNGPALASNEQISIPEMSNAEMVALRVRVIALENLLISLFATASDQQLELAREMAGYILPRAGSTQHPLTTRAAAHMMDLIDRASRFCVSEDHKSCLMGTEEPGGSRPHLPAHREKD